MSKPMVSNLKKLHESASGTDLVDLMMYMWIIVSLMYLVHTRPYICYAVSDLSQFMFDLRHIHWVVDKHMLIYLCCTIGYGLIYTLVGGVRLLSYTDSDWVGSAVD